MTAVPQPPPAASATPSAPDAVERALAVAERRLVGGLALTPVPLDPELARAVGEWKGAPVSIETRAWRGGAIRWLRAALVRGGGGLAIANVLALPDPRYPLPILGADIVALCTRHGGTMVAADLSPTLPGGRWLDRLAELRRGHPELPTGGALPPWCAEWFSPHALYTRVGEGLLPAALAACDDLVALFVELARAAVADPESAGVAASVQEGYALAHRTDDKGLGMLARMFGEPWAHRYVRGVLFPDPS